MATCPAGHQSQSTDYCDICGMPMGEQSVPGPGAPTTPGPDGAGVPAGGAAQQPVPCPNCGAMNPPDALFCEACGYDFTTGTMPRAAEEAASLLDIDAPVPAPDDPAPTTEPDVGFNGRTPETRYEAEKLATDEGMPGQPAPDVLSPAEVAAAEAAAADVPSVEPDGGYAGDTPATTHEAEEIAVDEGMPEAFGTPPAAVPETEGQGPAGGEVEWVAEVWIDPEWYEVQQSSETMPSPGLPEIVPLRKSSLLIGRVSQSRNIHPDIDAGADSGVSRRQAQLTHDGQRWFVEDLDSANGTYVGAMTSPLPETPIAGRKELAEDDRLYVGAWTRIVLRRATPDERAAFAL